MSWDNVSMARPVNADAQATQTRILTTAYDLFASRGMDGASIRDIAKGAGVSLAMVHHYFGSKQGLYEACIGAMLKELGGLRSELESDLARGELPPQAVLAEGIRSGFRYARRHRTAVRLLQRSLVDTGELDTKVREENLLPFLDMIADVLSSLTGRPARMLRLPVQSTVFLIVRFAITSEREIAALAGEVGTLTKPRKDMSAPLTAVEDHLVDAALRLVGLQVPDVS
jgi:AcrR family transcriptional regulator